ncbi:MAG: TonB-dependent receptor [Bradyrhizobiaceae bacterium]|nr:TonB-dependent receptor [Bradyrhizobiaceae bacterium]
MVKGLAIGTLILLLALSGERFVHGVVVDRVDRTPVSGVVVRTIGASYGAISNHHGAFHVHVPDTATVDGRRLTDSVCVELSRIGYRKDTACIPFGQTATVTIERSDAHTRTVEVVGLRDASYSTSRPALELTAHELDEQRGQTLADVLEVLPGVTALRTGASVAKPVVHGVTGQRIATSTNGVLLEGQQWGEDHGQEIDPFTPMQLSVVQGPASVYYGPGAMGGVINATSPPLRADSLFHGQAMLNLFSNNRQGAVGLAVEQNQLLAVPLGLRLFGGVRRAADVHAPDYALDNTSFMQYTAGLYSEIGSADSGLFVTLYGSVFGANLGVFSGSHLGNADDLQRAINSDVPLVTAGDPYSIEGPRQDVDHLMFAANARIPIGNLGRLQLQYGWQQNNRNEFDRHSLRIVGHGADSASRHQDSIARLAEALGVPAMSVRLTTYSLKLGLEHSPLLGMSGVVGLDASRQVNRRGGSVMLIPDYNLWGAGLFAHESFHINNLAVDAGLRYDVRWLTAYLDELHTNSNPQHRIYGSVSGGLGVRWIHSPTQTSTINLGHAWRQPQVNELYSNGLHHGAAQYEIGDSTLSVESVTGLQYAFDMQSSPFTINTSAYVDVYHNYIQAVPQPNNPTVTVRGTFPTARYSHTQAVIAGADVAAQWELSSLASLLAKAMVVYARDVDHDMPLYHIPPAQLRLALHLHSSDVLGIEDAFAELGGRLVARQTQYREGMDYAPPPPGYALVDLKVGGMFTTFGRPSTITIDVTNALNTRYRDVMSRYRYFADDAGINFIIRFTQTLGSQQ